jgi:hypothetical protein
MMDRVKVLLQQPKITQTWQGASLPSEDAKHIVTEGFSTGLKELESIADSAAADARHALDYDTHLPTEYETIQNLLDLEDDVGELESSDEESSDEESTFERTEVSLLNTKQLLSPMVPLVAHPEEDVEFGINPYDDDENKDSDVEMELIQSIPSLGAVELLMSGEAESDAPCEAVVAADNVATKDQRLPSG